jgi:O-antigen/teichoic acid export membrane protein
MRLKRLGLGVIAGFASFGVDAVVSTLVFPLLLFYLGKAEAGVWMLFSSVGSMLLTLLNGMAPAATRAVAQMAGRSTTKDFKPEEFGVLRQSVTMMHLAVSIIAFLVGVVPLLLYFRSVALSDHLPFLAIGAGWCGYLVGWLARVWVGRNYCILDGFGHVGLDRVSRTVSGLLNLGLLMLLLPRGWGVLAPVTAYAVIGIALYFVTDWLVRKNVPPVWLQQPGRHDRAESKKLAIDSGSMIVLGMTSYVVSQSCVLFVEHSHGAATVATFAPMARVTQLLGAAAMVPNAMIFPYLASAWSAGDMKRYRKLSWLITCGAPILYSLPAMVLFMFPGQIFGRWLGAANFVGTSVARAFIIYGFVYTVNCSIAMPALAARHRSFVREAAINFVLVIVLLPLFGAAFGLIGYPLAMITGTVVPSAMVLWQSLAFFRSTHQRTDPPTLAPDQPATESATSISG